MYIVLLGHELLMILFLWASLGVALRFCSMATTSLPMWWHHEQSFRWMIGKKKSLKIDTDNANPIIKKKKNETEWALCYHVVTLTFWLVLVDVCWCFEPSQLLGCCIRAVVVDVHVDHDYQPVLTWCFCGAGLMLGPDQFALVGKMAFQMGAEH